MPYKFQISRKPGRVFHIAADLLLALACFGALQTLDTTATATSVTASPTQPSDSVRSGELPGDAEHSQGVRETASAEEIAQKSLASAR